MTEERPASDAESISIELSRAEAVVLVFFLMRFRDKNRLEISHDAEEQILYDLCASVEWKVQDALTHPACASILERSRAIVLEGPSRRL
jgi:hypothetical protein